jgi:hypothetical protein
MNGRCRPAAGGTGKTFGGLAARKPCAEPKSAISGWQDHAMPEQLGPSALWVDWCTTAGTGAVKAILLAVAVVCLLFASGVGAGRAGEAPAFSAYPATAQFSGTIAAIDYASDPNARTFRTRLSRGIKKGPNFAGVYRVVSWGCGTDCTHMAIVNVETGRVCDWAWSCGASDYMLQSRLLIINPDAARYDRDLPPECSTRFYLLMDEKLEPLDME